MRLNEYFIPGEDIDREVITADIHRYLGNDALVRPGVYKYPITQQSHRGYFITTYRPLTKEIVMDLKVDSARRRAERRQAMEKINLRGTSLPELSSLGPLSPLPSDHQIVKHLKPNRKCLPIYINGHFFEACADFGSEGNIIRKDLADSMRLQIIRNVGDCPFFRLPTGRLLSPYGRTTVTCQFQDEKSPAGSFEFFIFQDFVIPLIFGKRFLRVTRTLDQHFHRLKDRPSPMRAIPLVAFLEDDHENQKEQISFWLDGEKLDSTPDTGSDINILSLDFALKRGYNFDPHKRQQMQFADGSTATSRGCITLHVSFGGDGSPAVTVLELVDHYSKDVQSPSAGGKVNYGHQTAIAAEFHILENLQVEVLLGVDVLATVDAFVQHSRHFKFMPASGLHDLFLTEQLSRFSRALTGRRNNVAEQGADRVQKLLIERAQLRAQADDFRERSSMMARSLSDAERIQQATNNQQTYNWYQLRIEEINREIIEITQQQAPNHPNNNLTRNQGFIPQITNGGAGNSNPNTFPARPFVSSVPSNYQPGALNRFTMPSYDSQPEPSNYSTSPIGNPQSLTYPRENPSSTPVPTSYFDTQPRNREVGRRRYH